jgi:SAM-dependent methyltransferase
MHLLNCPICQAGLSLGMDMCRCESGHQFPLQDGIPNIMLRNTQTEDHYNFQWGKELNFYKSIEDSNAKILKATASYKLGWDEYLPIALEGAENALDIACGYGGVADIFRSAGFKGQYLGIDINNTLKDIKNERYKDLPNFNFVRADMMDDIYRPAFDVVVCRSAIMVTADPPATFSSMARAVKPGGKLLISVYTKKSPMREMADDYFREHFRKMDKKEAFEALKEFTKFGKILSELNVQVNIPHDLPTLQIKKGQYDVQRLIYYHFLKCFWNEEWGMVNSTITNFDWYHPEYTYRYTKEEVAKWYEDNSFKILEYRNVPAQHFFCGEKLT